MQVITIAPSVPRRSRHQRGTILIIVAGLSALLASMSLVFLARMRSDSEETQVVMQLAQAKIMLAAACNYVQETSRLGWDANFPYYQGAPAHPSAIIPPPQTLPNGSGVLSLSGTILSSPSPATMPAHQETYGWIDVRDGSIGPNVRAPSPATLPYSTYAVWSTALVESNGSGWNRPAWPAIGSVAICPMYVMQRPPYATQLTAVYNPINTTPGNALFGLPYIQYPDPMPVVSNGWPQQATSGTVTGALYDDGQNGATLTDFVHGDPTPRQQTTGKSWFRVYRDGPATFVITCGSGATMGYTSYAEAASVGGPSAAAMFNNDPGFFNSLAANELRIWYRIEWSPSVMEQTYHNLQHGDVGVEHNLMWPANASHTWSVGNRTQTWTKNPVGTIRWVERLVTQPTYY
jgi:hypothetical protein